VKIATVINAHKNLELLLDTIDSIKTFVTDDILVVTDAAGELKNIKLPTYQIEGFYHNSTRSPYRNVALGLGKAYELFPEADWFLYCEPDCLFTSSDFKYNLTIADHNDIWVLGNDVQKDRIKLLLIEQIIKENINVSYYNLGCCVFYCNEFIQRLVEIDFFDKLINISNHFTEGFFPKYNGYDLSEHLYPTLCVHFGGDVGTFASWDSNKKEWSGNYRRFPMRWKPEIDLSEVYPETCILHPNKSVNSEIRKIQREKRRCLKEDQPQQGLLSISDRDTPKP